MQVRNILIADDDATNRKRLLSKVNPIEAAEQAFNSIPQEKPHVILLDLELPGMDGLPLVRKLKADPKRATSTSSSSPLIPSDTAKRMRSPQAATPTWSSRSARGHCRR